MAITRFHNTWSAINLGSRNRIENNVREETSFKVKREIVLNDPNRLNEERSRNFGVTFQSLLFLFLKFHSKSALSAQFLRLISTKRMNELGYS